MQITRCKIQYLPTTLLVVVGVLVWLLSYGDMAAAESYTASAHGKKVNRSGTGYDIGDCAHCHETFEATTCQANAFMLFAPNNPPNQDDNVCFQCHKGSGSVQVGGITNYDYSRTFGGAITGGPINIFNAFSKRSNHNLSDVLNTAKENWPLTFTDYSNPCSACHNVHIANRNKQQPGNPKKTAISLPSAHDELWGDGDDGDGNSERMSDYTGYYQAPYSRSVYPPLYEPDGSEGEPENGWGAKHPDYVTFCQDCHSSAVASTTLGRDLQRIDWTTTGGDLDDAGDKHGWNVATNGRDTFEPPYVWEWTQENGLVLSCTDCHEPHGSKNLMLLRRRVNGEDLLNTIDSFDTTLLKDLCLKCHGDPMQGTHHENFPAPYIRGGTCNEEHCHNENTRSGGPFYFIPCTNCHFHGGDDSWLVEPESGVLNGEAYVTYRRTF